MLIMNNIDSEQLHCIIYYVKWIVDVNMKMISLSSAQSNNNQSSKIINMNWVLKGKS